MGRGCHCRRNSPGGVGVRLDQAQARETVIVALGDSLTAGLGLPENDSFPAQLEKALLSARAGGEGRQCRRVWGHRGGRACAARLGNARRCERRDHRAWRQRRLQGLDPAATKATLDKIITKVKARGLPVLLAGMEAPRNLGKDYVDQFRAIYADLAQRYDLVFYPFFLDGVALDDQYTQEDGLHPNAQGVARIVERMLPKVEELLERVSANSSDGQSLR